MSTFDDSFEKAMAAARRAKKPATSTFRVSLRRQKGQRVEIKGSFSSPRAAVAAAINLLAKKPDPFPTISIDRIEGGRDTAAFSLVGLAAIRNYQQQRRS